MQKTFLVSLVTVLSVVFLISNVLATGSLGVTLKDVMVNGVSVSTSDTIAGFAGDVVPIKVTFTANQDASDVRIKAEIIGDRDEISSKTERFYILNGSLYTRTFSLKLPEDIDPSESYTMKISVYNKDLEKSESYNLLIQRPSYNVDVLAVDFNREVEAGSNLGVDIVLKNKGYERLDDLFVIARIPELGVEKRAYFEDLTPVDDENNKRYDSEERRIYLKIPGSVEKGIYNVEVIAYNGDTEKKVTKPISVIGTGAISTIITPVTTKDIAEGETKTFDIVLVNRGKSLGVYSIMPESVENLIVSVDKPVVTVSPDSSETIRVSVKAGSKKGTYSFPVNIVSGEQNVKKVNFTANVVSKIGTGSNFTILTIVLGIIFVVLLIVLIVLLSRKPVKSEEAEESYY